jgi:hypothetical protein
MFGCSLLALMLVGCAGSLPPELLNDGGGQGSGGNGGGGGGSGGAGGNLPPGCATAAGVFSSHSCTTVCHTTAGSTAFGGFDMQTAGWEKKLVGGMPPAQTMANMNKCGGMNLVYLKAGMQPAQGLFIDKLKPNPPCGVQMPQNLAALSDSEVTCIQNWANNIVAGGTGQ